MPAEPRSPAQYWDTYKPYQGEGEQPAPVADRFEWTQYPGHGPGAEVLGHPRRALDLGPAKGREAVLLARQGVATTGVDLSAAQVERARRWWKDTPSLEFVHAEVCDYLTASTTPFDAVYSVWGAVWFTGPELSSRSSPGTSHAAGSSPSARPSLPRRLRAAADARQVA
ncbi:bifunctional 2-polyprenyl-6-hydroxyphenol methylase/3-demethylubiquinol 3-O-methyltransferase UbiG [Streptomyces sp. 2R]|uniref:class I SAM-dependent methyltransferase n=1 Tax=Streptomyces sp. 2R TaxID=1883452 RepID=UPI00211AD77C|nr:class I SAM-dependent methyltransferase [Streptomyces sp. 2R]